MKKLIVLVAVFLLFDRFMKYKIETTRRYARLELARHIHHHRQS